MVLLIFLAVLLAVMLRGLADMLARHTRMRTNLALAVVSLVLFGAICGFGYYIGPRLVHEEPPSSTATSPASSRPAQEYGAPTGASCCCAI